MTKIEGQIVDILNQKIFPGKITINNGRIQALIELEEAPDLFIIPGFVDAHVHIESSMLIPTEFARLAVCHGTIGSVSDPHEIGNVLGKEGVRFMIDNGEKSPFKFYFGAPSCVPATTFETAGASIGLEDLEEIFSWKGVNYLAEMMNFPGVLNRDAEVMAKINLAHLLGKKIDGHAPGLRGEDAVRYIETGISTDHECFTKPEALEKLKHGMKIIIREGSAAKNFEALWELIDEYPDQVMLCSDDKHPNDLARGHINKLAAKAVKKGCNVMNVLKAASLNPIKHYGMNIGLLQQGDPADFCLVKDLKDFEVMSCYIDGQKVSEQENSLLKSVHEEEMNNFDCHPISSDEIRVEDTGKKVRAICVEEGQLITKEKQFELEGKDGLLSSDLEQDVLKMVLINRYIPSPVSLCFVHNFGLKRGAIASSVAHDSHNIIAVGVSDEDICNAVNNIIDKKGGVSLSYKNTQMIVPLPLAGLMSLDDGYTVAERYDSIDEAAKELGSTLSSPFMTLSFCALLVIPELKISDKGLFEGRTFSFTSIFAD